MPVYRVTLSCKGVPTQLGQVGAADITEEFTHRPWHQNVLCEWDGEQLLLHADSDWDADGKALLDEFSDAVSACIAGTFGYSLEVKSIVVSPAPLP
jgi:hypothetical protein